MPLEGHEVEWPNAIGQWSWSSAVCSLKGPPPPWMMSRISQIHFWGLFLSSIFWWFSEPPKSNFIIYMFPSWSQHVRFWRPTWPPKSTPKSHFFGSERQLMLRWVKNRPKCFRTYYLQIGIGSVPPNMAPKIVPTSIENRFQKVFMLYPVFYSR